MHTEETFIVQHAYTGWIGDLEYHTLTELPTEEEANAYRQRLLDLNPSLHYSLRVRRRTHVRSTDPADYVYHLTGRVELTIDAGNPEEIYFDVFEEIQDVFTARSYTPAAEAIASGAKVVATVDRGDREMSAVGVDAIVELLVDRVRSSLPVVEFFGLSVGLDLAPEQDEEELRAQILRGVSERLKKIL